MEVLRVFSCNKPHGFAIKRAVILYCTGFWLPLTLAWRLPRTRQPLNLVQGNKCLYRYIHLLFLGSPVTRRGEKLVGISPFFFLPSGEKKRRHGGRLFPRSRNNFALRGCFLSQIVYYLKGLISFF
jgi:hypothetical protein